MKPDRVVVNALTLELSPEHVDIGDQFEVGLLDFEVPEQRLDPCLISRGAGPEVADNER